MSMATSASPAPCGRLSWRGGARRKILLFTAGGIASNVQLASADLPVHCIRTQIVGSWKFHLGPKSKHRSTCGHATPDIDSKQPALASFFDKKSVQQVLSVELKDPNTAVVGNEHEGKWTMIYDEGVSVTVPDKYEFFSFAHFEKPKHASVHGKKYFRSFCGQSEIGWYRDVKSGMFGCYKAEKNDSQKDVAFYHLSLLEEEKRAVKAAKLKSALKWRGRAERSSGTQQSRNTSNTKQGNKSFLASATSKDVETDAFRAEKVDHAAVVAKINSRAENTWTAAVYSDEFLQQKMHQLQKKAMNKPTSAEAKSLKTSPKAQSFADAGGNAKAVLVDRETEKNTAAGELRDDSLPKSFSWSKANDGNDYLEPILDQQDCGSCYAVSSVHMLSARYRVMKQNPKLEGFSINLPLYCSDLNQGCQGGYPSLVSMWSKHVGLVPKSCVGSYFTSDTMTCKSMFNKNTGAVAKDKFVQCVEEKEKEGAVGKVKNWSYIGGFYGNCNVASMMQDLYKYGPLAVALEPGMDFMYYRSGVYKSSPIKTKQMWVKVDHAVLLIGWGEDATTKQPYWTIQNSWGSSWGENGNIRIVRGENESGVEFQAVAAYLEDGKAAPVLDYLGEIVV